MAHPTEFESVTSAFGVLKETISHCIYNVFHMTQLLFCCKTSIFSQSSRKFLRTFCEPPILSAPDEFAQTYVIAHEIGHHVQNLTGVLSAADAQKRRLNTQDANDISVRIELQAVCYAGIWAHYTGQKGLLEAGDIDAALNAAHKIGDDTWQKQGQGYVVPDSCTHGTSARRAQWFNKGYHNGKMDAYHTFKGDI